MKGSNYSVITRIRLEKLTHTSSQNIGLLQLIYFLCFVYVDSQVTPLTSVMGAMSLQEPPRKVELPRVEMSRDRRGPRFELQLVRENLFNAPPYISLGHCVAKELVMNRGIAKTFREKFGQVHALKSQGKKLGEVAYIKDGERYVFYLISKRKPRDQVLLDDLLDCLVHLKELCLTLGVEDLALPQIGRGLNNLEWFDVSECLKAVFRDSGITVFVCHSLLLYQTGNYLHAPSRYSLVHCVQCDFTTDRPMSQERRYELGYDVGWADMITKNNWQSQGKKAGEVASQYSQDRWHFYLYMVNRIPFKKCIPTVETFQHCLENLKNQCKMLNVCNLAICKDDPFIKRLCWVDVKQALKDVFDDDFLMEIVVYTLP
jgi:hypothetical protein